MIARGIRNTITIWVKFFRSSADRLFTDDIQSRSRKE
jgi:hypothetical protein